MSFNEKLPEWGNPGAEPPANKKQAGFLPGEKPPADWFNWLFHRGYKVLEEIRSKVELIGNKGKPGGYASLDDSGKVPADQLPFNEELENTVAQHTEDINQLEERLDTEQRQDVVLNAGMQILNAQRSAAFSLNGIKGRTLVNLLGKDGNFEDLSKWTTTIGTNISSDHRYIAGSKGVIATNSTMGNAAEFYKKIEVDTSKYYLLAGYALSNLDIAFTAGSVVANESGGGSSIRFNPGSDTSFTRKTIKFKPTVKDFYITFYVYGKAGVITAAVFDAVCLYELSASEYAALDNMTTEQINTKYPYVDSVQPVRNAYAIRYGENLLPPFYEYVTSTSGSTLNIKTMYEADLITTATTQPWNAFIPVLGGGTYTLSYESSNPAIAYINLQWLDEYGVPLGYTPKNENGQTVQAPASAVRAKILVTATAAGTFNFKNPMLTLGSTPKPFKPREDAMLALQTDLNADPLTGANADEVFEKDGQYFKLAKWKRVALDETISGLGASSFTGFKVVAMDISGGLPSTDLITKYDGKVLSKKTNAFTTGDMAALESDSRLRISISNTDSGWGDNYSPTADEIKAYFMGWVMRQDGTVDQPYTSGVKFWRTKLDNSNPTNILPTTQAPNWTPYQLVYQLATPTVEPIVSEGMLTFNEGDNQIEVGTGMVVRESVKPYGTATTGGTKVINYKYADVDTWLKYPLKEFVGVYRNGALDPAWDVKAAGNAGQGLYFAQCFPEKYDDYAAYSVTYKMLDKSPIAPFTGSYGFNESALLLDLLDTVKNIMSGAISSGKDDGIERKNDVVASLNSIGVTASTNDSWETLLSKIELIITADGDAEVSHVLAGRTFTNKYGGGKLTGTIPNLTGVRTATGAGRWPDGAISVYPERGYQAGGVGGGEIKVLTSQLQFADGNLVPGNILSGKNIFGVVGTAIAGKRSASGTTTTLGQTGTFYDFPGQTRSWPYVNVSGLSFEPSMIFLKLDSWHTVYRAGWNMHGDTAANVSLKMNILTMSTGGSTYTTFRVSGYADVRPGSFQLPTPAYGTYSWWAIE